MKKPLRLALILTLVAATSCGTRTGENTNPEPPQTATAEETTITIEETTVNKDLGPALISAANRGDAKTVRRLLEQGANVEARDDAERTPLIAAAYGNHVEAAEALVEAGADVNAKDETVQSAYLISTSEVGDDPRLLDLTLKNGADVKSLDSYDGTGLIRAAERGYPKVVDRLLETNIDVDHVNNLEWTALLEAIILGDGGPSHTEVVRLLIQKGNADPNLPDGNGITPLQHARQNNYTEIVEILQRADAK
jgi:ankyrin repeat protein